MTRRTLLRSATALAMVAGTTLAVSGAAPTGAAELGPDDFQVSQGADQPSRTAIAHNATDDEYLVVWSEADATLESRIYGNIVDSAGASVSGDFVIAELGSGDPTTGVIDPDVAWNSIDNEYVVVMAGDDAPDSGGIITSTFEIYVQRVTAVGGLAGSLTEISDMGAADGNGSYDAGEPAIAYNPGRNEYLVVWEGDDDTAPLVNGEIEIYGQLLTNSIGEIGTDTRISNLGVDGDGATDARSPAVAALNGAYAVVWHGNDASFTFEIYGQLVDAVDLTEVGTDTLISTDTVNDEAYDPAIAGDPSGSGALVVWEHDNGAGDVFEVAAAPITATGSGISVGPNDVDISGTGAAVPQAPSVAFNTSTGLYSVVWAGDHDSLTTGADSEVIHTVLESDASVVEAPEVISDMAASNSTGHPDVAPASGAQYAAVWVGDDTGTGDTEVFGQFVVPTTDLEITSKTLTSADPVLTGGAVTYEIAYANNGPIAVDAIITDVAPTGVTFDSFSSTGPTLTQRAGDDYSWDVTIPAGGSGTITINGTAGTTQGTVTNTATIATAPGFVDEVPGNNSDSATVFVDAIPTVTIEQGASQNDPTNDPVIVFDVTFSESVTGFADDDVVLGGTGSTSSVGVTGSGTDYTVTVTASGDGTIVPSVRADAATDTTGNLSSASTSTDNTVTYDGTAPTSQIVQAAGQADPTNGSSVEYTVTFSEPVTGFESNDVDWSGNSAPGVITTVITGGPSVYTATLSGYTGDGNIVVFVADGAAFDEAGNSSVELTSTDAVVTIDRTAPTVTIDQAAGQDDPTNASPIVFDVVFSEAVTGFDETGVSVSGSAGPTMAVVTPVSSTEYTVSVSGMTGDGDVTASVDAGAASDAAGNTSVASTSTDDTVGYDAARPTVTVEQFTTDDPTNAATVSFEVRFSEGVSGFTDTDVTVGGTAPTGGVTIDFIDPNLYYVNVIGITGDGTVTVDVPADGAQDAAGNTNLASTSVDNEVTVDQTAPTSVIEQAAGQADPSNGSSVEYTVTFSEPVSGFDEFDVDWSSSTVPGTITTVITGGPTVYTATLSGYTGDGDIVVFVADGAADDAAGNSSVEQASPDSKITIDRTAPTVTIDQAAGQDDPTSASPIVFDVVFSEPVTGFDETGVTVSGSAGPTTAVVTPVSSTEYTVSVSGMTGDGDVTASVDAGAASDAAGNTSVTSTSTDDTVSFDATRPTVTIEQAAAQDDPTNGTTAAFTVTFSEPVTGLAGSAFDVGGTATTSNVSVTGSGSDYEVTVTGISTSGTVTLDLPSGSAQDDAGNTNLASTSIDNEVTVDQTAPIGQLVQAAGQPDPTNSDPVFTVTFSEPVTDFDETDVDLSTSTTPGTLTAVVTGGPTVYDVTVSGFTDEGDVIAIVLDGAATDLAGNASIAMPSPDNVVTIDLTLPTVTIEQTDGQADPTNELPVSFTVEFSRDVTGFAADDVVVTGTAGAADVAVNAVSATEYIVEVSGTANDGTITVAIGADAVVDIAGNGNTASTSTDDTVTYDTAAPILSVPSAVVEASTDPGEAGAVVDFVVTATDPDPAAAGDRLTEAAGDITIICDPASGSFFPIGQTTVTCTATDAAGNSSSDSFVVEVVDDEDPVIQPGVNQTFNLSSGTRGPVTYSAPTATDNSGQVSVDCTPTSGSTMPAGANTVTCTARDLAGNSASTSFTVTVVAPATEIPATGGGGTGMVPIALALVLTGLALITTNRRRTI